MLKGVRLFKDGTGFVLRIMGLELEEIERIPPSEGDRLLHARIKELGLSESADLLLKGEELVIPTTRHRWPLGPRVPRRSPGLRETRAASADHPVRVARLSRTPL